MEIDTTNMCSHLKRKLFEEDGPYHKIWLALQADNELTAIVRSRQLHIYRNGKMVLILAGKAAPKVLIEDRLAALIGAQTKQGISLDDVIPQNVVCSQELRAFFVENIGKGFHFKAEFQDWLVKLDDFLKLSGKDLLTHSGRISAEVAKKKAGEEYAKFHQRTMYELSPVELHFIENFEKEQKLLKSIK